MGGMIAQSLAIAIRRTVRTLISVMSTTGIPPSGSRTRRRSSALLVPPPPDREAAIGAAVWDRQIIGSPGYPSDEEHIRARAGAAYDRALHPAGSPASWWRSSPRPTARPACGVSTFRRS